MPLPDAALDQLRSERAGLLRQALMSDMGKALLLFGAGGAAYRGAQGLFGVAKRNMGKPKVEPQEQLTAEIPYPVAKAAAAPVPIDPLPRPPTSPVAPAVPGHPPIKTAGLGQDIWDGLSGSRAYDLTGMPLAYPGMAAASAGGAYGGYKLMDYLLQKRRKSQGTTEEEKARQEYEQALLDQQKSKLGQVLDDVFDLLEKQGDSPEVPAPAPVGPPSNPLHPHNLGAMGGGYLLTAGGIAAIAAAMAYNATKKRSEGELLRKAYEKHQREQAAIHPAPIYAKPVRVAPSQMKSWAGAPEDDETGEKLGGHGEGLIVPFGK